MTPGMTGWRADEDEAIRSGSVDVPAPGLEGQPRFDMAQIEGAVPKLLDHAVGGPVVMTRPGAEAYGLLPLDIWRRVWLAIARPPVIEAERDPAAGAASTDEA
jgi:hypothetical protein